MDSFIFDSLFRTRSNEDPQMFRCANGFTKQLVLFSREQLNRQPLPVGSRRPRQIPVVSGLCHLRASTLHRRIGRRIKWTANNGPRPPSVRAGTLSQSGMSPLARQLCGRAGAGAMKKLQGSYLISFVIRVGDRRTDAVPPRRSRLQVERSSGSVIVRWWAWDALGDNHARNRHADDLNEPSQRDCLSVDNPAACRDIAAIKATFAVYGPI